MTTVAKPLRLLDTDVLIDIQHQIPNALTWFSAVPIGEIAVSGFVAMEIEQSARNAQEARSSRALLRDLTIFWPNDADLNAVLADFRALHLGHGIGIMDCLVAATARGLGGTLCTFNTRHFRVIPGLAIEQPYVR